MSGPIGEGGPVCNISVGSVGLNACDYAVSWIKSPKQFQFYGFIISYLEECGIECNIVIEGIGINTHLRDMLLNLAHRANCLRDQQTTYFYPLHHKNDSSAIGFC